jgi:mono/diheme cytochrome c family protein
MKWAAILFALIALAAGGWYFSQPRHSDAQDATVNGAVLPDGAMTSVTIPATFTDQEKTGKRAYDAVCADCHGVNAQGTQGVAPPLVHRIYEPSHHGEMAFLLAAQNGVRAHHWTFGNMPAIEGVTRADVMNIVSYVRALQRANGIE